MNEMELNCNKLKRKSKKDLEKAPNLNARRMKRQRENTLVQSCRKRDMFCWRQANIIFSLQHRDVEGKGDHKSRELL